MLKPRKSITTQAINWIKDYFKDNPEGKAIIGISGGKDSTVTAALCVEALGKDRVIGVMMPNTTQADIADSAEVCRILDIKSFVIDIGTAYNALSFEIARQVCSQAEQPLSELWNNSLYSSNTPARLRMTALYSVAALFPNSRVANTCNLSEDFLGWSTKFGDAAGDFSPLGNLTVREVMEIGDDLGIPYWLVHKVPHDGMCGKTDEDKFGFSYEVLDAFLLDAVMPPKDIYDKIMRMHKASRHKYTAMPTFHYNPDIR